MELAGSRFHTTVITSKNLNKRKNTLNKLKSPPT